MIDARRAIAQDLLDSACDTLDVVLIVKGVE
jgi:hypothetical protein